MDYLMDDWGDSVQRQLCAKATAWKSNCMQRWLHSNVIVYKGDSSQGGLHAKVSACKDNSVQRWLHAKMTPCKDDSDDCVKTIHKFKMQIIESLFIHSSSYVFAQNCLCTESSSYRIKDASICHLLSFICIKNSLMQRSYSCIVCVNSKSILGLQGPATTSFYFCHFVQRQLCKDERNKKKYREISTSQVMNIIHEVVSLRHLALYICIKFDPSQKWSSCIN